MKGKKIHRIAIRCLITLLILGLTGAGIVFGINGYVVYTTAPRILSPEEATRLEDVDCILVLGCLVHDSGRPSDMLSDRLRRGVELYQEGAGKKLLMSGDHGRTNYNEVQAMKQYAMDEGVAANNIFMDHAGFSTYESLYRARDIFQAEKILIVTQEYHLHRALYIANALGLEAYGVSANYRSYTGQTAREIREILARNKDFFTAMIQPKPTYLGETIPISGDGNLTND